MTLKRRDRLRMQPEGEAAVLVAVPRQRLTVLDEVGEVASAALHGGTDRRGRLVTPQLQEGCRHEQQLRAEDQVGRRLLGPGAVGQDLPLSLAREGREGV